MFGSGVFGSSNEPQSAAFGPQQHRKLFFNKQTLQWEPIEEGQDALYDKTFATNSARGAFPMMGRVAESGPDTSSEEERSALSPQGEPDFYGGSGSAIGGAASGGSLEALRELIAAQQRKARGF